MTKLIVLISPAKSLDWESPVPKRKYSIPKFLECSEQLIHELKKLSVSQISELMNISTDLSKLNYERYHQWSLQHQRKTRPAMYAFAGDVYQGLDAYTMSKNEVNYAKNHLRILSGLYGLLNPLDKIYPYRLEMGTKLNVGVHKNLYQFWDDTITSEINSELTEKGCLVNLASEEYFKSVQVKSVQAKVITPVFYDFKNGEYKIISFYAKKARGMMARFIIDNQVKKINDLKGFDTDGYEYNDVLSEQNRWVFTRG